ncbi:MAG: nascent polypeptide-associated complex protein [Halobacteriales archaeon]|nr:nascent polypeptide-associated complex protein [Halobacteriales archaeon]
MFGGGGGLNPRKMQKMMEQMGIDVKELDAESAVIRLADGTELVFDGPEITRMDARGQQTYQVVGSPEARAGDAPAVEGGDADESGDDADGDDGGIPDDDVALVAEQAGASEADAREALDAADGDLAAAIDRLS